MKNVFREIRSTMGRFIAIFAISALGAGFFAGLKATSPDMKVTADHYYDSRHLMDIRLLSTMGFTEDDVAALRTSDGVDAVMAGWGMDLLVTRPEGAEAARLLALPQDTAEDNPDYLNRPVLQEGRMPQTAGECLADSHSGYAIGDVLVLSPENGADSLERMLQRKFTVVGIAASPSYVSLMRGNTGIGNGKLEFFLYLHPAAFDPEYYTEIFLTLSGTASLSSFAPEYDARVDAGVDALEALGEKRAQLRYDEVYNEASTEIADAEKELADERQKADEELANAWQDILDAEAEIASGWDEYHTKLAEFRDAEAQIADAEQKLADARIQLLHGEQDYDAGMATLEQERTAANAALANIGAMLAQVDTLDATAAAMAALLPALPADPAKTQFEAMATGAAAGLRTMAAALQAAGMDGTAFAAAGGAMDGAIAAGQYAAALGTLQNAALSLRTSLTAAWDGIAAGLQQAEQKLHAVRGTLDDGWWQLHLNTLDFEAAKAELEDGRIQLANALATLTDAEAELADGKAEYEEKKAEALGAIADAKAEIADAWAELNDLAVPEWYVRTRTDNSGYSGFASDTGRIDAIAAIIPVFFFLVAVLVCLTTMTRMVEEQRTLIGTLKALGYGKAAIAFKYLLYAGIASATGAVLGVVVGSAIFPVAIWQAYSILYTMPALSVGNSPLLSALSVLVCVLCTTLATLASCMGELRSVPAHLMRPRAPRAGKRVLLERIGPVWRRLSFMAKVTVRNLFRYKKRFFMTVLGVAGCTALLITGFGLSDSIVGIVPRQFGIINTYDAVVALKDPSDSAAATALNTALEEYGSHLYISETLIDAKSGRGSNADMTTYLFVAEQPQALPDFIRLAERTSQQPIAFPAQNGVVITEKLAAKLKLDVGDSFEVNRVNETPVSFAVAAISENYTFNYVYLSPQQYRQAFGATPEYNQLLMRLPGRDAQGADDAVSALLEVDNVAGASSTVSITGQFDDMFASLNAVIWLIILAAGMLAFVVLYNLTNINITERAREIATLKVLGFYNGEVASYVYRENLVLTLIGILLGFGLGYFLHGFVITTAEVDEVMFMRVIEPLSYLWSVLFTLGCAGLVNLVMLRRLRGVDMVESLKATE